MFKLIFVAALLSGSCVSQLSAQYEAIAPATPRLAKPRLQISSTSTQPSIRFRFHRAPRVGLEILGGLLTAFGGIVGGMALGEVACNSGDGLGCLGSVALGGLAGGLSGAFAGVVIMGSVLGGRGSIPGAILGMVLGGAAGVMVSYGFALANAGLFLSAVPGVVVAVLGVIIGYEVGAARDERPDEPEIAVALVPRSDGATLQLAGMW